MITNIKVIVITSAIMVLGQICASISQTTRVMNNEISWANGIVWYQIFPERFYNADSENDPSFREVVEAEGNKNWKINPWTSDWYEMQPWEESQSENFYDSRVVYARRYGGDLGGVILKLDYLKELGIDGLYFNPVFEAPSLHKYDAASYHHIDNNFGRSSGGEKEAQKIANETEDPSTWIWTRADSTFLKLISEAHQRGIRIVIDGVFNHTGIQFFAFQDILKNGKKSKYKSWYHINQWDDPDTPENEFDYKCWWGFKIHPEIAEDNGGIVSGPREYIFNITRRWMDPNGDGDPTDGIDGWRLDVANEVSPKFWKEWYKLVKSINPGAITVAEIWDDASEWILGGQMDNTMNYLFARSVVDFFIDKKSAITSHEFIANLEQVLKNYGLKKAHILWNLINSHDTDRLASMILNPDRDYDHMSSLRDNPSYDIRKPNNLEREIQKQIVAFQMTYIGAPMIYYGDEAGMWGADDPDDRKPMVWPEYNFDIEKVHPIKNQKRPEDKNGFNFEIFKFYQEMIKLRHEHQVFMNGDIRFLKESGDEDLVVFKRIFPEQEAIIIFNRSDEKKEISIKSEKCQYKGYRDLIKNKKYWFNKETMWIQLEGRGFLILLSIKEKIK